MRLTLTKKNIEIATEIATLGTTTVCKADFKSESMKELLHSMATKGEFQFGIKIVNSMDGTKKNVRFVHWLSALVKKLNNKRKPPPDWKPQSAKKKKS